MAGGTTTGCLQKVGCLIALRIFNAEDPEDAEVAEKDLMRACAGKGSGWRFVGFRREDGQHES